jgi:hypothetical protein
MTDQELAKQIAQARLDETDLLHEEASIAERRAFKEWRAARTLYLRVEAGDPDAIRQVIRQVFEGER